MSSEFLSAIAGAIVGGAIAALLQWLTLRTAAKERSAESLAHNQALALALLFKIVKIQSDLIALKRHVDEAEVRALERGWDFDHRCLVPLANYPKLKELHADEMGVLFGCQDNALLNDVLGIDDVHAGEVEALRIYGEKRAALSAILPAQMDGLIGTITLSPEDFQKVAPRIAELDQLAKDIRSSIASEADSAMELSMRAAAALKKTYDLKIDLALKAPKSVDSGNSVAD